MLIKTEAEGGPHRTACYKTNFELLIFQLEDKQQQQKKHSALENVQLRWKGKVSLSLSTNNAFKFQEM